MHVLDENRDSNEARDIEMFKRMMLSSNIGAWEWVFQLFDQIVPNPDKSVDVGDMGPMSPEQLQSMLDSIAMGGFSMIDLGTPQANQ